jgi:flavin-dependent dehydrogenase
VDPCLGVGISMALASAEFAARAALALLEAPAEQAQWIARYEGDRKILFQHFNAFGRVMRALVRSRSGGALLVQAMRHWPGVAESLLDIVARGSPWRTFTWPALLRPVRPANRAGAGLTG